MEGAALDGDERPMGNVIRLGRSTKSPCTTLEIWSIGDGAYRVDGLPPHL